MNTLLDLQETSPALAEVGKGLRIEDLLSSPDTFSLPDLSFSPSPLLSDTSTPFLTSPLSPPPDEFISSGSPYTDFLTSPVVADVGFGDDMELFGGLSAYPTYEVSVPVAASVAEAAPPPSPPPKHTRKRVATGTRKNLQVSTLIPIEAPTQKRSYVTPSATSRKAVPAAFAKKRAHSDAFGDEELVAIPGEQDAIEHKRRQNTLAARKSRKRKLEHQQLLEDTIAGLKQEAERWRERAIEARVLLEENGIVCDEWQD
ncbi:unnamed protein product [Mycena citricolor]|uniref:BZIP domain-containing protein n=1 Tax=Mycena citricolor TaxID=2018698 RepID=A0AAD2GTQ6_9AGAR|nr:unnamed protein product [Mycena citricolor]CAK5261964.1 unnamed protein product [Mycena citricolor]CAK5274655.1 unnamed protein product [Mycena citricolor]